MREPATWLDVQLATHWLRQSPPAPDADVFVRWFSRSFSLDLGHRCNQDCRYCSQDKADGRFRPVDALEEQIVAAAGLGFDMVTLIGGEPLLHPDFDKVLSLLRREKISRWGVMSNGILLAQRGRLDRLVEEGLGLCQISLDSPTAAVQNDLGRNPLLFEKIMKALKNCARHPGLPLHLKAVVVRPNVGQLVELVRFVDGLRKTLGIRPCVTLTQAKPFEAMEPGLMVGAKEAAASMAEAVREGRRLGLPVFFFNLPFCLMEGLERSSIDWFTRMRRMDLSGALRELPDLESLKSGRCALCRHDETCPGYLRAYADRFGDREFQPVLGPASAAAAADAPQRESRLPVGEWRADAASYFSARELRARLPERRAASRLVLCGPEPTLHPRLPELVREYASEGFEVWLETTGVTLAKPRRAEILRGEGLRGVLLLHPPARSPLWAPLRPESLPQDFRRHIVLSLAKAGLPCEHVYPRGDDAVEPSLSDERARPPGDRGPDEDSTVSLLLGTRCNFRCEFCYHLHHRFTVSKAKSRAAAAALLGAGCRRFILAGGEPTVFPHLMDVIDTLSGAGAEVVLVSNGYKLADKGFCRRLKESGIERVILSLHTHQPEVAARVAGIPGVLPAVLDGFSNLLAQGLKVSIHHVLNAENYREFEQFVRFYAERLHRPGRTELSVSNIIFLYPVFGGRPERVPRLSAIRPCLEAGMRAARESGFEVGRSASEDGFPDCVFGVRENVPDRAPQRRWIVDPAPGEMGFVVAGARELLPGASAAAARDYYGRFAYQEACRSCKRKPFCLGIQTDYVALHGAGELRTLD